VLTIILKTEKLSTGKLPPPDLAVKWWSSFQMRGYECGLSRAHASEVRTASVSTGEVKICAITELRVAQSPVARRPLPNGALEARQLCQVDNSQCH
jgi:hypothetical protein